MYKVSNIDNGLSKLSNTLELLTERMNQSSKQLKPVNQMHELAKRLPEGFKGRSVYSDRDLILINFESKRIAYNRSKGANLDLYTFITKFSRGLDIMNYLDFLIITEIRANRYRKSANYLNNKKVKQ